MKHRLNFFFPFTSKFSNVAAKLFNFPVWSTQIERKIGPNVGIFHHHSLPWPRCHVSTWAVLPRGHHVAGVMNDASLTKLVITMYPLSRGKCCQQWPETALISALLLLVRGNPGPPPRCAPVAAAPADWQLFWHCCSLWSTISTVVIK